MIEALRALGEHDCEVVAVASVQEEVGLRGARVATARMRPDIGLAIDITLANDAADSKPHERITALGGGRGGEGLRRGRDRAPAGGRPPGRGGPGARRSRTSWR